MGRYKWFDGDKYAGVIELRPDHSFFPPGGNKAAVYQWEIGRNGLFLVFFSGLHRFTNIESAGIYIGYKPNGQSIRMERLSSAQ